MCFVFYKRNGTKKSPIIFSDNKFIKCHKFYSCFNGQFFGLLREKALKIVTCLLILEDSKSADFVTALNSCVSVLWAIISTALVDENKQFGGRRIIYFRFWYCTLATDEHFVCHDVQNVMIYWDLSQKLLPTSTVRPVCPWHATSSLFFY